MHYLKVKLTEINCMTKYENLKEHIQHNKHSTLFSDAKRVPFCCKQENSTIVQLRLVEC